MTTSEVEQCKRFREIRDRLGIRQADFAKGLAVSQGHVSDIENGRKSISDRIVEILVLRYGVNDRWLRTGDGEMLIPISRDREVARFIGSALNEGETFKTRLIAALSRLDSSQWEAVEAFLDDIVNGQNKKD